MNIVLIATAERHRIVGLDEEDADLSRTACGMRVLFGAPCPNTAEHLLALPGCRGHEEPKDCLVCFEEHPHSRDIGAGA